MSPNICKLCPRSIHKPRYDEAECRAFCILVTPRFFNFSSPRDSIAGSRCFSPIIALVAGYRGMTKGKEPRYDERSLLAARLGEKYSLQIMIALGLGIITLGIACMFLAMMLHLNVFSAIFLPMFIIQFSLCFILANATTLAMQHTHDKANGSAVMNFINMGVTTVLIMAISHVSLSLYLLPIIYFGACFSMWCITRLLVTRRQTMTN